MDLRVLYGRSLSPLESLIARKWRPGWVCSSCRPLVDRSRIPRRRWNATKANDGSKKPFYVTTPIFYVNAAPHVGHLYSMVLADVMKRWAQLQGRTAILCTGTDEHGMKIQQAAQRAHSDPKTFCDRGADVFKSLAVRGNISNDHFVRTTDPAHREAVEYAWHVLQERGLIYESKHEGWYSVSDETFYPESAVHLTLDPPTGRKLMTSIETGKEVQWTSERNYHFRLSAFREDLLKWYSENPDWITPPSRMKEIESQVEAGLEDLSISRPIDRLTWGIRVPGDPSQTMYVWLDALLNYISKIGYPWVPGSEPSSGWPADIQVIGKDITRFHCIYWPAFLMALGLPLPKKIMTHAHWTMGKQKMSKSIGNVVNPFFAIDRFGVDPMRYFLTNNGGIVDDADYDNAFIVGRYKGDLKNSLGNAVARVLRSKTWVLREAVERYSNVENLLEDCAKIQPVVRRVARDLPVDGKRPLDKVDITLGEHLGLLQALPSKTEACMQSMEPNKACREIMHHVFATNGFLQAHAPWTLVKRLKGMTDTTSEAYEELKRHLDCVLYLAAESIRVVAILFQPVMPDKASLILDMLGVDKSCRSWDYTKVGADKGYGTPGELRRGQEVGVVFLPLPSES